MQKPWSISLPTALWKNSPNGLTPQASYTGYNFITDAESPTATEIAVFGLKAGDPSALGSYFVPPPDSDVAKLVKGIARIDPVP